MSLLHPLLLLLLLGGAVPGGHALSMCGWRKQLADGNNLRYYRSSTDDTVTVLNTAKALMVISPFAPSGNITLQTHAGMYVFCVHWLPALRIFNITYGVTKSWEVSPRSDMEDDVSLRPTPPTSCDPEFPLINVTINGQLKGNSCHFNYSIQALSSDTASLEHEISQVGDYLDRSGLRGNRRELRRWIDTALSAVQLDGDRHHFGKGSLEAAVYRLDSADVLNSIPESLGVSLHFPTQLLETVMDKPAMRLYVVRLHGPSLFQDAANSTLLGDQVVGISLQDTKVTNLPEDIVLTFQHQPIQGNLSPLCVFWDESSDDWSTYGCRTAPSVRHTSCRCNHLTYFAVLMQVSSEVISEVHLVSLSVLTFAGCSISALSCLFTIGWICCTRKMQTNPTLQIHMNLLGAVLLLDLSFILSAVLGALEEQNVCRGSAIALHFALLCTFAWMAIEGFNLYQLVVKVFQSSSVSALKLALLGWGVPVLIVTSIILMDVANYGVYYIKVERPFSQNSTASICWLTEPIVHQVVNLGFFATVLLFNICMLVAMTRRVLRLSVHTRGEKIRHCVTLLGLSCMLGLPWGTAFFSFGALYLPVQYFFSILNALQGLFIFLWYCALSQPSAKHPLPSSESTSTVPMSPRADQSTSSDHKKLLT
ncbi:adhesion G-protein coupled receptor G1-like [Pseudophryne corroboree]|uniref:adhesion G-protein coupled receptor G1-like n=1 Tax=Pseudophryne corroboree TaxID=495146 RepID=UPI003081978E